MNVLEAKWLVMPQKFDSLDPWLPRLVRFSMTPLRLVTAEPRRSGRLPAKRSGPHVGPIRFGQVRTH